jgi:GT2 family glycosyltransferase
VVDISIIIVSWNAKDYLCKCLESIYETKANLSVEIIVVDNDSSDGSPDAVEKRFPEVKLIRTGKNLGFAGGNNVGIKMASGHHVFLINSDVVLLDNTLVRLAEYLDTHPRVGIVSPRILNGDGSLQHSCRQFPGFRNTICELVALPELFPRSPLFSGTFMYWWAHDTERKVDVTVGCFWAVRREALEQVGGLDETFFIYGEDIDWCKRFGQAGWEVVFFPGTQAIHYGGASSANAPIRFYLEMQKTTLQYWEKYYGKGGRTVCWLLIAVHQTIRLVARLLVSLVRSKSDDSTRYKIKRSFECLRWLFHSETDPRHTERS